MTTIHALEISDLIPENPDPSDPLFNTKIAMKKEFNELKPSAAKEPPPKPGESYKHQLFGERFIAQYDRLLLCHMPGTGKSCIMIHAAEALHEEYNKSPDITKINGAIILVPGSVLSDNIKNEILCKCTDGTYITGSILNSLNNPSQLSKAIEKSIKTWYEITTYFLFAKKINAFARDEDRINYLSNKIILVDEAHNLPTDRDKQERKKKEIKKEEVEMEELDEEADMIDEDHIEQYGREYEAAPVLSTTYEIIHKAFHMAERTKIILATATPMINSPVDICALMNLILPLDKQMKIMKLTQFLETYGTVDVLEPFFRGMVSYIRAFETGAVPVYEGEEPLTSPEITPEGGWKVKLVPCPMSEMQTEEYIKAEQSNTLFSSQKQASNFVFPLFEMDSNDKPVLDENGDLKLIGTTSGVRGFEYYIQKVGNSYDVRHKMSFFKQVIADMDHLRDCSSKYATIIEICKSSHPKYNEATGKFDLKNPIYSDDKGIVFVYFSEFVVGSGVILLGICMKEHGYREFTEKDSFFEGATGIGVANVKKGPCTTIMKTETVRKLRPGALTPRFAILRGGRATSRERYKSLFDTLNSYENRYGELIQVIIGSRVSREGISINNAVKMIFAQGSWNFSNNNQAMNRVLRATSHEARLAEKPPNSTFEVVIYNLVSVKSDGGETIDFKSFLHSELKDRNISKVMRPLKQSAVDCYINRERNIRPFQDVDGSSICDYQECDYQCMGIDEELLASTDYRNKLIFYSEKEVNRCEEFIKEQFSTNYSMKRENIHDIGKIKLEGVDPIHIDIAIERMIRENKRVINRMGYRSYIRESINGLIFLQKDPFNMEDSADTTIYNSVVIGTQDPKNNTFADYTAVVISMVEDKNLFNFINPNFRETVSSLIEAKNENEEKQIQDYMKELISVENIPGKDKINKLLSDLKTSQTEDEFYETLEKLSNEYPDFGEYVSGLSLITRVELIEDAVLQLATGSAPLTIQQKELLSIYANQIFNFREPIDALRKVELMMSGSFVKRGRKPLEGYQLKMDQEKIEELLSRELYIPPFDAKQLGGDVIVHSLLNERSFDRTEYGRNAKFMKGQTILRVLKIGEGKWRDPDRYEQYVYSIYVRKRAADIKKYFDNHDIYGIMFPPNNKFLIRDKTIENTAESKGDSRKIKSGLRCSTWSVPALVSLMYRLAIPIEDYTIPETENLSDIRDALRGDFKEIDNLSDEEVEYYYKCYQSRSLKSEQMGSARKNAPSKGILCRKLQEYFTSKGLMMTPFTKIPSSK